MAVEEILVCLVVAVFRFALSLSPAPSPPLNFTLSEVTMSSTELQASWIIPEFPNGVIMNYTVVCNGSIISIYDANLGSGDERAVTLTGLDPYTVYECSVFATTDGGVGNASETSVARTAEDG